MQGGGEYKHANPTTDAQTIRAQIGGAGATAERFQDVRDPYRGDVVAHAPVSSHQDLDDALAAAHKARRSWRRCRATSGRRCCAAPPTS